MNTYVTKNNCEPKLVCNNKEENTKVIEEITKNLDKCESFSFSVAFISESGISSILQSLLNARNRGVKGRIVTSTYLSFNTPKVFQWMLDLFKGSSIEIRIYQKDGFHPKGYIFDNPEDSVLMIGSSNLTQDALNVNQEWNVCLNSNNNPIIIERVKDEFSFQWNDSIKLTNDWISSYSITYKEPLVYYLGREKDKKFEPNKMQTEALLSLKELRKEGKDKALLISATGTGKTYLSAFDVRAFNPKRMLFVVHRETIARKSLESYKDVIKDKTLGMFTGTEKDANSEYLFSTINTISKDEYLHSFKPNEFDYIVIDEVHRAGAKMYEKILKHFKPAFLLGMSATPERTDKPEKIYEMFEYNIAYEIRLKQAMEFNLLCPFHYFGITDLIIDNKEIDEFSKVELLTCEERAKHVIKAIKTYGYCGDKPHGLIFVSRKEEAYELSRIFNKISGYRTKALTGNESDQERRNAISLLEEIDERKDYLDYIFTVDIFNEGIDIPCINQVIMLRPTQSSIIFIQQLGRGLRKNPRKEYVTVIDVIGNYVKNNFLIPIALSGSLKMNKEELRKFMFDSNSQLPGCSTIYFDEITKAKIYESIDQAKLNSLEIIKDSYQKLKAKLANKIPTLMDFDKYSSIDPLVIISANSKGKTIGSYYRFLKNYEPDYKVNFKDEGKEERYLRYVSLKFMSGKRVQELELIKCLIEYKNNAIDHLKKNLKSKYGFDYDEKIQNTIVNELSGCFCAGSGDLYQDVKFLEKDGNDYKISEEFKDLISNEEFLSLLNEIIDFGIHRYNENYANRYNGTDLVLYQKYTYDDVFRLLNWNKATVSLNVGGYMYDKYSNTLPVFINYEKVDVKKSIMYEDEFESPDHIKAISKNGRTIDSNDAQIINNAAANGTNIHMFMRKNKDDNLKEFYYLGTVRKDGELFNIKMSDGSKAFGIPYKFDTTVRDDIFTYICD